MPQPDRTTGPRSDEDELRSRVRSSLESILGDSDDAGAGRAAGDVGRLQSILSEETERYYERMGLVKHISRSGRVFWVTPEEKARLDSRRHKRRKRRDRSRKYDKLQLRTVLIWGGCVLFAVLLLAYLFATEVIG